MKKIIYSIKGLMNKLGVSDPEELKEFGYDVEEWYSRHQNFRYDNNDSYGTNCDYSDDDICEYDHGYRWNTDDPTAPDYIGT